MNTPPRKEQESGLYAPVWRKINQMIDYMREISVVNGRDIRMSRTMNGTMLLGTAKGEGAPPADATISRYRVESVQNDYLVCKKVEGSSVSSEETLIAKPFNLRRTGWHGVTMTYTDEAYPDSPGNVSLTYQFQSATYRIAQVVTSAGTTNEHQVITPHYLAGVSIIKAMEIENGTGVTDVTMEEINDSARAWARVA